MPLVGFAIAAMTVMGVGAISGSAIGKSPMLMSDDDVLPSASAPSSTRHFSSQRLPDHYPLVTPDGTVPVAELAMRGRYRDRQVMFEDDVDRAELAADYGYQFDDGEIDRLAHGPALEPRAPEQAEPPAPLPDAGGLVHNGTLEVEALPRRPVVITIQ